MRITAIESQANSAERVNVYVDGEFRCGVAFELVRRAGLRSGDRVDAATLERLEREDLAWKAREAAYSLLAYRARTRWELRRRLSRKGFPEAVVEATVDAMVEKGYVDDASFAASFARDRVRLRPSGPRRIVRELRAKGVAAEVAGPIVEEVFA
ncbi:MAG: regulatory protein RecX, partial [Gemmatimonadota bacterium]